MPGTKISILKTLAIVVVAAQTMAAATEYFPLQVGNSWVYRVTQGRLSRPGTIEVLGVETVDGREYFRVKFFENDKLYLRQSGDEILAYDPELKQEGVWLSANTERVQTMMDACSKEAHVRSTEARVKTELGEFNNTLHVTYTANCADAGVTEQYFLPYIGLIVHETSSIAGPVRHELVYSRTGITAVESSTNAFTLALDKKVYQADENAQMLARVTLRLSEPTMLTFPSGQSTEMKIYNDRGEIVYTWSADKLFPAVFREERVGPGERSYAMEAPLGLLPPGRYIAQAWLTTQPRTYTAEVTFEIVR